MSFVDNFIILMMIDSGRYFILKNIWLKSLVNKQLKINYAI